MEVDPITPASAAEKLSAWLAVRDALEAAAPSATEATALPLEAAAEPPDGASAPLETSVPPSEPALPGADTDFSREAATVQTAWRAPAQATDEPHRTPEHALAASASQADFALPAALLAPAVIAGLRIEPGFGWQLPPVPAQWPAAPAKAKRREPKRQRDDGRPSPDDEQQAPPPAPARESEPEADRALFDASPGSPWCEPLSRALRAVLAARIVPQALLAAADQWKRGRCVVLACPQGADPAGPAWAFVLWPVHPGERERGVDATLSLRGLRVEARLQWSAPPRAGQWCHVRVVKEHHPRTGRQLVSLDEGSAAPGRKSPVQCEVQLGPVLARSLRWCEVCVRIQAAQRFWNALGAQWSVHVVVSAQPLIDSPATTQPPAEASPC